jgi:hypothetical protein
LSLARISQNFVEGRVSFTIQDNGEGNTASPDLLSDIGEFPGVPASCADEMYYKCH